MFDLAEPIATDPGRKSAPPNASPMLVTSTTSPTRVDVPWHSIIPHDAGDRPALRHARCTASR